MALNMTKSLKSNILKSNNLKFATKTSWIDDSWGQNHKFPNFEAPIEVQLGAIRSPITPNSGSPNMAQG